MSISLRQKLDLDRSVLNSGHEKLRKRTTELDSASQDLKYTSGDSFLAFVNDASVSEQIAKLVKEKCPSQLPKAVFVVGIGGANLASKAIYDALIGYAEAVYDLDRKMIFLDTVDEAISEPVMLYLNNLKSPEEFVIVVVSKSGTTLETLANTEFLVSRLEKKFGDIIQRIVIMSQEGSPLAIEARAKGITFMEMPKALSDRFLAFSPLTLLPLALYGIIFQDFLEGAKAALSKFRSRENLPANTAVAINHFYSINFNIYDIFLFSPRLETLGKWQRQLIAESLGKDGKGLDPTVSIGTADLHSGLQLTLGGPENRFTTFVSVKEHSDETLGDSSLDILSEKISSKPAGDINAAILRSVQETYFKRNLPFADIVLDKISLSDLGQYMIYAMLQTVFLGTLMNVDVYSQPSVEEYKQLARKSLE